ncbi:MAG: glycosyltransferase [Chitinivibrionales bacterium]|nr:glycosyltransferase [Chitinivibrionales bacterium]MBD3397249.1 glycosyltransferase [Chitinivibrionales bacterium]
MPAGIGRHPCRGRPAQPPAPERARMNILVLNWRDMKHPEAGGAEVHFQQLFRRLAARGHRITLLTTRFPGSTREDRQDGIRVLRWGHTYTFNWEAPWFVRTLARRERFDCIVDDVNKIPFFTPRWFPRLPVCAFFHHLFGATIFDLAAYPLARYVLFFENLSAWGYRNVSCCAVSPSTVEDMVAHGFDRTHIRIIENSVDADRYVPPADRSVKRSDMLVFMGRIKRYKNLEIVLDALRVLADRGRQLQLVVAGTGDHEDHLKERTAALGLEQLVRFAGFVDDDEKTSLLQQATLFVNPSHKEGWGIANIEANACGTAVVANNAPGLRDSVRHGQTGLLYRENDKDNLITCITDLLDNPDKRRRLEAQGREWAVSLSWDSSAAKVEQWLTEVSRKE